jgi:hypothetical protein
MNCKPLNAVYGRLTVLYRDGTTHVYAACSCGSPPKRYWVRALRSGNTQSCGCLARERQSAVGVASATHGMTKSSEYKTWAQMRKRCADPSDKSFANYGGRGIKVCERWAAFENFYADMGPRPSPKHTLDRRDNDGDYSPDNCRWATKTEQTRNRRNAITVTLRGQTKPLMVWCEELGFNYYKAHRKLRREGQSAEQVFGGVL